MSANSMKKGLFRYYPIVIINLRKSRNRNVRRINKETVGNLDNERDLEAREGRLCLIIPVEDDHFAVPIEAVLSVDENPDICSLPTAPRTVCGLINLRGEIVPLLDTGYFLGLKPVSIVNYAVTFDTAYGTVALAATGVPFTSKLGEIVGQTERQGTKEIFSIEGKGFAVSLDIRTVLSPKGIAEGFSLES